jgi:transposase
MQITWNAKTLIKAWLSDKPTSKIAKEMGVSEATLYARASYLRKAGVKLPARTVSRAPQVDVNDLNQYIEQHK